MNKNSSAQMNPNLKPPDYKPPTSAEELRERCRRGECYFVGTKLSEAVLDGANLSFTNLSEADFSRARLVEASLLHANLSGANFSGTDLFLANLNGANLDCANLRKADLSGANLQMASLNGADFSQALCNGTLFVENDLRAVRNLAEIDFGGPCHITANTIALSRGALSESYLRGCGLSEWEVRAAKLYDPNLPREQATALLYEIENLRFDSAIQINPVFISYCHADAAFVDAVGTLLDRESIRFWRDVHDATAGRFEKQIDRAIRMNPTVLLVLSADSIESDWVEWEAVRARELEKELGRDVLCPVALDDSWKTSKWPGHLRQQIKDYNILDFSGWVNSVVMERQFKKLLDGLTLFYEPSSR